MDPTEVTEAATSAGMNENAPAAAPEAGEMQGHEVAPKPKSGQANKVLHQIDDRFKKTMEEVTGIDKMINEIKATSDANSSENIKKLDALNKTLDKFNERFDALDAKMDEIMQQLGGSSTEQA